MLVLLLLVWLVPGRAQEEAAEQESAKPPSMEETIDRVIGELDFSQLEGLTVPGMGEAGVAEAVRRFASGETVSVEALVSDVLGGLFAQLGSLGPLLLSLMLPVLLPIANGLGLDLVHFGVMVVLNLMIGQVTPPFGVCLFVISDVNKVKLEKLYKSILPFLVPLIATLFLVTYLPGIVTWLPTMLLG